MVLQMKVSPMEQIKKVSMIRPIEWEDTHLDAHKNINAAIAQFYGLFDDLFWRIEEMITKHKDAEEKSFASFSKINSDIKWLRNDIKWLIDNIKQINLKLNEWRKFITKRYEWIVDTDKETTVELETIGDEELKGKQYLANVVVNEASPNQWAKSYSFPNTSLVKWEYTPRIKLKAKEGEHAVLEYDFTVILTEV